LTAEKYDELVQILGREASSYETFVEDLVRSKASSGN
jgi:hypothetical protein